MIQYLRSYLLVFLSFISTFTEKSISNFVFWKDGRLMGSSGDVVAASWIQPMRSARDRHEQNVELVRGDSGFYVTTMRQIGRGEQLLIWYGEGLARELGVPILTPCHIRGHQEYVCTACLVRFTHPNTLKAHISFQCSKSMVPPMTTGLALVPFHRLLQTISKASFNYMAPTTKEPALPTMTKDTNLSVAMGSRARPCYSGCEVGNVSNDEELVHKSAFKAPSTSRETKREISSEDGLMTPDSSTDQKSALNLSIKSPEIISPERVADIPSHPLNHWNALAAQQMMAQSMGIPFDYAPIPECFPISPHLHALSLQLMNCGQTNLQQGHPYRASLGRAAVCPSRDYAHAIVNSQMEETRENMNVFKTQAPAMSPSVKQIRPNNAYGFTLPSDKEPLDLLPQAYFANKSKKGHLCLCCGKLYSRKYGLKIHMRTHNGYKPLKCKICSRPFGDPSNLNKHVRLHAQGETPYRCEFCGKVLVRRRDLERHVRSRHPMGCGQSEDTLDVCDSSPESSPASVEGSDNSLIAKDTSELTS